MSSHEDQDSVQGDPSSRETDNWRILISTCRDQCPHHDTRLTVQGSCTMVQRSCDLLDNKTGRCEIGSCPLRFGSELARLAKVG